MDYVLDANVVMGILISGRSYHRQTLRAFNFYCPDFVFDELELYRQVIQDKAKLDKDSFRHYVVGTFSALTVLPKFIHDESVWAKATALCRDVDPKDVAYVALSLTLDCPLLTRDRPLHEGLRRQGFREVELFDIFLANLP
jgi:predicted nucleic acid-binding protein